MSKCISDVIRAWPSPGAEDWVRRFLPLANSSPGILAVVAFGSAVRWDGFSADVDLLVIYEGAKLSVLDRPADVDIRWFKKADAEKSLPEGHELLAWIIKYGELICEKDCYWTNLQATWQGRVPFPSAQIADDRAKRAERLRLELVRMGDMEAAREQGVVAITQLARACLIRNKVFPASRPELPSQLRTLAEFDLATQLENALRERERRCVTFAG